MLKEITGGICAAAGFKAGAVRAGIKATSPKDKPDIAIIFSENRATAAAVYTTNKVKGAPLLVTKEHLRDGKCQAVIVNSGNANTCNANGIEIAVGACRLTAEALGIEPGDVAVASTGVIGQPMSIVPFEKHIPALAKSLRHSPDASREVVRAIMTTDTREKSAAFEFSLSGSENEKICRIGGISKGSGMIAPNMATMLCFITTDVNITESCLHEALLTANRKTFNQVSVDRDTSTNDTVLIMASGLAGNDVIDDTKSRSYAVFLENLYGVMRHLARETARDGEGATKLIECRVTGALTERTAAVIAKSVVESNLLKAAIFAADANWGRILCAIGYADADFDINKVDVVISSEAGSVKVCENAAGTSFRDEDAHNVLLADEILITVNLFGGGAEAFAWGCDLTYDYVKINAEYRT
ncbi:arginine biosynthesis bifunctional protein ArgJ [Clostridia bacterium]|nr:arginine biosynthesis bifunctional protein ArgJ [Clostridia bacterium]